jgi:curved DNA-binding protein CbpA
MDPFDRLGLPRRPLLYNEEIGTAYRKLAGEHHPDQNGGEAFQFKELGEAQMILLDPAKRLRALSGIASSGSLPPAAAAYFPAIATLIQQADSLLEKRSLASNDLGRALLAAPLKMLARDLEAICSRLDDWLAQLNQELVLLDSQWPRHDPVTLNLLADSFSYASRWQNQLRERKLALDSL